MTFGAGPLGLRCNRAKDSVPVVDQVDEGGAAAAAGFMIGATIAAISNTEVHEYNACMRLMKDTPRPCHDILPNLLIKRSLGERLNHLIFCFGSVSDVTISIKRTKYIIV